MSSVFNTHLVFASPYSGNYVVPGGYRYYWSWDAVVLYGAGVNFSDQQHNNNRGPNYFSFLVKRVLLRSSKIHAVLKPSTVKEEYKLTAVLYKCPAKYENGNLVPIHTKGFINLENYILYSDPECVLAWGVFPQNQQTSDYSEVFFDFSLSCNKPFNLGPNEVLCFNYFVDHLYNIQLINGWDNSPGVDAKVVFDIN